jgi:hypothetical protein
VVPRRRVDLIGNRRIELVALLVAGPLPGVALGRRLVVDDGRGSWPDQLV